jgi:hypothetical protein
MRILLLLTFCIFAPVSGRGADRPTLQSLVGREFLILDDWAGQALAFKNKGDSIYAVWRILGSGVPVLSEAEYPVEMKSPFQCVFEVQLRDKSRSMVKVGIGEASEVRVFLNGVRIMLQEKQPNQSLQPTAPSGRGSS